MDNSLVFFILFSVCAWLFIDLFVGKRLLINLADSIVG